MIAAVLGLSCVPDAQLEWGKEEDPEQPDNPVNPDGPAPTPDEPLFPETTENESFGLCGADELKVMSFNIKVDKGDDPDNPNKWENRREACVFMIMEQYPAIIGLQEAYLRPASSSSGDQYNWLKKALKDHYDGYAVERLTGKDNGYGESAGFLYNKHVLTMVDKGAFWLSETPDVPGSESWGTGKPRTATWAIFTHNQTGKSIAYINTHLDNTSAEARKEGMKLIVKWFEEHKDAADLQVLMGDFNAKIDETDTFSELEKVMKNTRSSAPENRTDTHTTLNSWSFTQYKIIDHIYVSLDAKVMEYRTISNRYGNIDFISDHYPIISILKLGDDSI